MRSLGPGVRFHPTDVELIMYYLKRKVTRRKFHRDGIRVLDVYNFAPWDLQGQARWKRDRKWYFFCPRERKYLTGKRTNRAAEHGFWKTTGKDRQVLYNGEIVGMIKSLIFHMKNPTQRTNWVMHEYKLWDEYLKQLGLEEDAFVLCVIFEKEGPGPRNGAQYGGPYRDEDWDDDGDFNTDDDDADVEQDNHGEDTHGIGALTHVHDLTDKGKSIVPNDFDQVDRNSLASSSRTLQSHIDQSVTHGFPPTPVPGTLPGDSRLPLSDECGIFAHEVRSASLENEQAQIPQADYMELEDMEPLEDCMNVSGPFEGSHVHDHVGPGQPSPYFGPVILESIPDETLVGQQNWGVVISDIMPSWNGHHHESVQTNRINDPQTGSSWFTSSNFPHSGSSELHMTYLHPHPPVSKGSVMFSAQGIGEYEPFLQHPQFPDGFGGEDIGDNVPYLNEHPHLAAVPMGFGGQGLEENVLYPYSYQRHQFAQGPIGFGDESLRENLTTSHGPEFAEDSTGLGGRSFGENGPSLNQHHQTADGFIGHEMNTNGQMGHHFASVDAAAPFGNVQPPQSLTRGERRIMFHFLHCTLGSLANNFAAEHQPAPINGTKRSDGYAIFFPYGDSSVHVKAEVNPFGRDWRTNDALSNGSEEFSFVTVECNRNGNAYGKGAVLYRCGYVDIELFVLLAIFGDWIFGFSRVSIIQNQCIVDSVSFILFHKLNYSDGCLTLNFFTRFYDCEVDTSYCRCVPSL